MTAPNSNARAFQAESVCDKYSLQISGVDELLEYEAGLMGSDDETLIDEGVDVVVMAMRDVRKKKLFGEFGKTCCLLQKDSSDGHETCGVRDAQMSEGAFLELLLDPGSLAGAGLASFGKCLRVTSGAATFRLRQSTELLPLSCHCSPDHHRMVY